MSWTKKRERLHEAAVSSIRAISKNKKISSNTGLSQRPPTNDHVALPNVPRSFKDLNKWRGESDFQAFWHLFHKKNKDFQLTLPARMIFNELEIARVELLGSSKYLGSARNISEYTNSRSNELEDEKSLNFLSYGANLWLKEFMNFDLSENSKNIISKFIKKYKIDASANTIREDLIKNLDDQANFEKNAIKFLKKLDLVKESVEDEENDFEEAPGSTDDIDNNEETVQEDSGIEEKIDLKDFDDDLNVDIQDAIANIDDTSIEDEIESLTYPNNDFQTPYKEDYSIYTSNFDEIIDAKDLVTNEESMRLRNQLDNLIKPHIPTIGKLQIDCKDYFWLNKIPVGILILKREFLIIQDCIELSLALDILLALNKKQKMILKILLLLC